MQDRHTHSVSRPTPALESCRGQLCDATDVGQEADVSHVAEVGHVDHVRRHVCETRAGSRAHLPRGTIDTRSTFSSRPVRFRSTDATSALPTSCTAIARLTGSRSGSGGRRTPCCSAHCIHLCSLSELDGGKGGGNIDYVTRESICYGR